MPKWTSALFTDIRGALGTSVVFSNWKGRPYLRSWVSPSNPRTNLQQANRDIMRKLVQRYQSIIIADSSNPAHTAIWNTEALPYAIAGFNIFTKWGRKSSISVPATASGTGTADIEVTYTLGIPASKAVLYHEKGGVWTDTEVTLVSGTAQTVTVSVSASGTYTFWIANKDALETGDTAPQDYQAITCYSMPTGAPLDTALAASCVVTVS
jgi:hypothetical protein